MHPPRTNAFLVVADSPSARQTLRNTCTAYDDVVVDRFGRAVLFDRTELGAFLAFRLAIKHGDDVTVVRTETVDEEAPDYRRAYEAAVAFENRSHVSTPYPKFAAGTEHPSPEEMRERDLSPAERPIPPSTSE